MSNARHREVGAITVYQVTRERPVRRDRRSHDLHPSLATRKSAAVDGSGMTFTVNGANDCVPRAWLTGRR